ncbi:MAG: hypothetical protein JST01_27990 [Cyanobacteria bacterium SZAS TMP-1]|nr:hypothetical protein [Cyanobacteria bacterium SZAS TMP-1]
MNTSIWVRNLRRHINCMLPGQIFTTREMLIYGPRSVVDHFLYRNVRDGLLVRLARGVFTRNIGVVRFPSPAEIAEIKARAFGKELRKHGADSGAQLGLVNAGNAHPTFYVDGSSSSFRYGSRTITLKRAARKRMRLADDRAGLFIRALWYCGRKNVNADLVEKLMGSWGHWTERKTIYSSKAWMPSWLGDLFLTERNFGPFSPVAIP